VKVARFVQPLWPRARRQYGMTWLLNDPDQSRVTRFCESSVWTGSKGQSYLLAMRPSCDSNPRTDVLSLPVPFDGARQARAADILAVVVCYQPDVTAVVALAQQLRVMGRADVLLVENTESPDACERLKAAVACVGAEVVCQGMNLGVAEAHNIALRLARQRGYRYVLLLDQDTRLEDDTLPRLVATLDALRASGERVAGVGAAFSDPRGQTVFPFVRLGRLRMHPVPVTAAGPVECDLLISSGCLIPLDAVEAVGLLDSGFFIDYVDMEWCARARARGWKVFGVPEARMRHTIGDATLTVLGRTIPVHSPQRQYYLIRNALLFARKPYLPLNWRVHLVYRAVTQVAMFGLLCRPRAARLHWLLRGFMDGLLGRNGRLGGPSGIRRRAAPAAVSESAAASRQTLAAEGSRSELVE
jgi:rhamnosyltransferase